MNETENSIRRGFRMTPALNGGWVVTDDCAPHMLPSFFGAYSNSVDLIEALKSQLLEPAAPNYLRES